jgi:site-specific DNA-methyltransferase (adenine-specific)
MSKREDRVLYYGDNLEVMRLHVADESVDLIYLDPPFNSKATYNVLFETKDGSAAPSQIKAFDDTWHWDMVAAEQYHEVLSKGGAVANALRAFEILLGRNDMLAYLTMMAPRLVELRRKLKQTGSLYLHCDPTASHYLKVLLDAIFGAKHFLNEIVWHYSLGGVGKKWFGRKHDTILFYAKSSKYKFYPERVQIPRSDEVLRRIATGSEKATRSKGQKKLPLDVWEIQALNAMSKERLGYPTQKPLALLERIVLASSDEGDVVMDPFCGCGTAIVAAHKHNRRYVGIDITHLAIGLMRHRLQNTFGSEVDLTVKGEPESLLGAIELARQDKYQLQWWALGKVGARPDREQQKKGADGGIDGRLYFEDDGIDTKEIVISVKGGKKVNVGMVRDLAWTAQSNKAQIGVLISLAQPTQPMRVEATKAGFYKTLWGRYPRIQLLTIEDIFAGKRIEYPEHGQHDVTLRKAPRIKKARKQQKLDV